MLNTKHIYTIRLIISLLLLVIACPFITQAQNYQLDSNFVSEYKFKMEGSHPWEDKTGKIGQLIRLEDNTLRVTGDFEDVYNGYNYRNIIKLLPDGSFDPSFVHYGYDLGSEEAHPFKDYLYTYPGLDFWRLDMHTGAYDTAFNNTFRSDVNASIGELYIFEDSTFLVGGDIAIWPNVTWVNLARFNADGTYDTTFTHDTNGSVLGIKKYDEDRLMLMGSFNMYDSIPSRYLVRIYNDGTIDTTFHSIFPQLTWVIHVQDDGKIICGGRFKIDDCDSILGMVRINANGSLDSTFNNFNNVQHPDGYWTTLGLSSEAYYAITVCPTENGKYLIGGHFVNYQGYTRNRIALVDYNGFLDTTAFTGSCIDTCINCAAYSPYISCIIPDGNDSYLVAGEFRGFNGHIVEPLIRIYNAPNTITKNKQTKLSIFPNPAKERFDMKLPVDSHQVKIINSSGQVMYHIEVNSGTQCQIINCSNWAKGIYYCSVLLRDGQYRTTSLAIER
jgi:hypothetical protein